MKVSLTPIEADGHASELAESGSRPPPNTIRTPDRTHARSGVPLLLEVWLWESRREERMGSSQVYVLISLLVLAIVAVLVFLVRNDSRANRLTPLAITAFAFVIAGIVFGDNKVLGYSLIGVGIALAVADILRKGRR